MDNDRLYLLDGSGFIHRAFHAIPPLLRADGTPVNAVLGFSNMMLKCLAEYKTERLVVVMDCGRKNWRHKLYDQYKANRGPRDENLGVQFPIIYKAITAFGFPMVEMDGYEADDIIATYARVAVEAGFRVTIVSSDKDLMQLINDDVEMLDPLKNVRMGAQDVFDKFGVLPHQVEDFQALKGDSVDNVPGVAGIGDKKAAALIKDWGTLEGVYENIDKIEPATLKAKLQVGEQDAFISKKLVHLHREVPLLPEVWELNVDPFDAEKLLSFCDDNGLAEMRRRVEYYAETDRFLTDPIA